MKKRNTIILIIMHILINEIKNNAKFDLNFFNKKKLDLVNIEIRRMKISNF